ncbi:MAG: amidohydrolase family protein, partial [Alphaproteobacteria bacterium]
ILVPPSWEGDYNDVALRAAANHPDRFAVMGRLDLSQPAAPAALPQWRDQPGMLGIRLTFLSDTHKAWLATGALDAFWKAAEAAEIPLMVLPPDQIPAIVEIANRHPKLKLIIDHLAMTSTRQDAAAFGTVKDTLPLADCQNVAVKASALPCYTTEPYPYAGIRPHIEKIYNAFGPARTFWGTDFSRLPCTYREGVTHFTETLPFLDASAQEQVMGAAICDWLGWRR